MVSESSNLAVSYDTLPHPRKPDFRGGRRGMRLRMGYTIKHFWRAALAGGLRIGLSHGLARDPPGPQR